MRYITDVAWSHLCVGHMGELCKKNGRTDQNTVWYFDCRGPVSVDLTVKKLPLIQAQRIVYRCGTYRRHMANMIEQSVLGGDAGFR